VTGLYNNRPLIITKSWWSLYLVFGPTPLLVIVGKLQESINFHFAAWDSNQSGNMRQHDEGPGWLSEDHFYISMAFLR
jgi:hypothetical protein